MPAQNLHRIMGSRFEHIKPNLCPNCAFRQPYGEWEGFCQAHGKVLSAVADSVKRGRCKDYQRQEVTH